MAHEVKYRFPAIRPFLPPPSAWVPYLDPLYAEHWFSNFSPVATQFERELTARFCHPNEVITCSNNATSAATLIALDIRGTGENAFVPKSAISSRLAGPFPKWSTPHRDRE
jgi:hypothetical protein